MEKEIAIHWVEDGIKQARLSLGEACSCLCTIYHNGKAKIMMVDSVETLEQYRAQGYGRKLMKGVIGFARTEQVDAIELVVGQGNVAAVRLYEKTGFKRVNKFFYRLLLNVW